MHTRQPNPQSMINEYISGKIVVDNSINNNFFLALNVSHSFATIDPITRQTYDYATPIACDNYPRNIFELDPASDDPDFYFVGPEPINKITKTSFNVHTFSN